MTGKNGKEVGRVSLRVLPNMDHFKREAEKKIRQFKKVKLPVEPDLDKFERDVERETKKFREAEIKVKPDIENFKRKVEHAAREAGTKVEFGSDFDREGLSEKASLAAKLASRYKVWFRADLDTKAAMLKAFTLSKVLQEVLSQKNYKFDAGVLSMHRALDEAGILDGILKGSRKVLVDWGKELEHVKNLLKLITTLTPRTFSRAIMGQFTDGIKLSVKSLKTLGATVLNSIKPFSALMNSMRGFASLANVFSIAMAVASGAALAINGVMVGISAVIGYITDAIKQLSRAALLVPGILGGIGIIGATMFTGFRGMSKALSAAVDLSADLETELEGLTPSAANFARSLRNITPAWSEMRKEVQQKMFDGLGEQLEKISATQLPVVQKGMSQLATTTNGFFKEFGNFAGSERTAIQLGKGFMWTDRIVQNMKDSVGHLLYGIQDIGVIGLRTVSALSRSWAPAMEKFSAWTDSAEGKVTIQRWIEDSIQGFKDLGSTIGNVYETFKEIGNSFGIDFDSSALEVFKERTADFREWIGTADDADSRISRFTSSVKELSGPWIDAFKSMWTDLQPAFSELLPLMKNIASTMADDLASAVEKLAPKLESFFKFLSNHGDAVAKLVSGFMLLRLGLGVFKLGRMFLAPFTGLLASTLGFATKLAKIFKKKEIGKGLKEAFGNFRAERQAAKDAKKEAKSKAAAEKQARKESRDAIKAQYDAERKAAKDEAKKQAKEAKANKKAAIVAARQEAKEAKKATKTQAKSEKKARKESRDAINSQYAAEKKARKESQRQAKSVDRSVARAQKRTARSARMANLGAGLASLGRGAKTATKSTAKLSATAAKSFGGFVKSAGKFGIKAGGLLGKGLLRALPGIGTALMAWDIGSYIFNNWDSIKEGFGKFTGWAGEKLGGLKEKASDAWEGVKEKWSTKWDEITEGVSTKWDSFKEGAASKWDGAKESIANTWDGIKESWTTKWDETRESLTTKWDEIKTNAATGWEEAKTNLSTTWDGVKDTWTTKWDEIKEACSTKWQEIKESASEKWGNAKDGVSNAWDNVSNVWGNAWTGIGTWMSNTWNGIKDNASNTWSNASTTVNTAWDNVSATWNGAWSGISGFLSGIWGGIKARASSTFQGASSSVTNAWNTVSSVTSGVWGGVVSVISGAVSGILSTISGTFSSIVSTVTSAMSNFVSAIGNGISQAVSHVAALPGQVMGALGNVGGILVASGRALIQGFINGITSMIGAVASAASSVVSAARAFFPFSPAKKGPFSGRGYTTHSGKALVRDFTKGMLSEESNLDASTAKLLKSAQKHFGSITTTQKGMEGYQRKKILDPVLESNAEKIAKWREKDAENLKKSSEKISKINAKNTKANKKAEQIAKEKENLTKKNKESYKDLLESLEAPDYSDIDRSLNSYWIEGVKEQMNKAVVGVAKDMDLVNKSRAEGLKILAKAKSQFGNVRLYPGFDLNRMSKWLKSKEFGNTVYRALEEANIGAIPIEFAISNIDQLRSDLNMGDGVISRAIDAGMDYNSGASDMKYERDNKVEIHYHVADMQEAIRLEKQRERKQMMKMKR